MYIFEISAYDFLVNDFDMIYSIEHQNHKIFAV